MVVVDAALHKLFAEQRFDVQRRPRQLRGRCLSSTLKPGLPKRKFPNRPPFPRAKRRMLIETDLRRKNARHFQLAQEESRPKHSRRRTSREELQMILTQCAVCATELGLSLGKKCGRCSTRYCGAACQVQHWKEGGHDRLCKTIKKAGGAEQYNANQKYTEAVSVAVEKCAEDTKGQTCYICTEAVHRRTGEGLVRGCACHTTEGFVHVSCLAEQAELLVAELTADDLDLDDLAALGVREGAEAALKVLEQHIADDERSRRNSDVRQARWDRWSFCNLCGQRYHGVVQCALGWACWKTYLGRPGTCWTPIDAMTLLGLGLAAAHRHEEHLVVVEAQLAIARRAEAVEQAILNIKDNVANCYRSLGRQDEALAIRRAVYARSVALSLPDSSPTCAFSTFPARCSIADVTPRQRLSSWSRYPRRDGRSVRYTNST